MATDWSAGWTREGGMTPYQQKLFRDAWGARQRQAAEEEANAPQNAPQAPGRPFATGGHPVAMEPIQAAYLQQGPHVQAAALQGAIDKTADAWKDENDSRVAQVREMRRLQHEKDMEAMRQEGLLRRLAAAQANAPESVFGGTSYMPTPQGRLRVWNPQTQQFDSTDEVTTVYK